VPESLLELRVLVLAPNGRDANLIVSNLCEHRIAAEACDTVDDLCESIGRGAGTVITTEEALHGHATDLLTRVLALQPPWSDLPIIILTTGGDADSVSTWSRIRRLEPVGNVSLLERPLRSMTLVSAVQVALRSRRRQYEVRALHASLERRVQERTSELQRLNQEAEGFNYSISHDLRTPLRTITSTSQMILEECGHLLPESSKYLLNRQAQAAKRLAVLMDDLLRLSRLSRHEIRLQDFDLTALAREVADEMATATTSKCNMRIQPDMRAHGDAFLVRFVLLNLLENACKFSPEGGTVWVGQDDEGAFFVRDQGIGFDVSYLDRIFLPFERLVSEEDFPGTGIGLANVKRIVDRHGGKIWAESEPGAGASFFFTL
jgi:signal transduction histidine kinase